MSADPTPASAEYRTRCLAAIEAQARDMRECRALLTEMADTQHVIMAKMCVADAQRATAAQQAAAHTPSERR